MIGREIAADRAAPAAVAAGRWRQWYDEHAAGHLGDHQPVGGRLGRIEQRVAEPDLADVFNTEARVLEQVRDLLIDLKWPVVVEVIDVESSHVLIVDGTTTDEYALVPAIVLQSAACRPSLPLQSRLCPKT